MRIEDVGPASAPSSSPRWTGFRGVDRSIVRTRVADLVLAGATTLTPAEMFVAVCETVARHLFLINAGFFKRVAGQSRTLVWSTPGVTAASRMTAREQAWTSAAELLDEGARPSDDGQAASVSVSDERLGLSAMLYVESRRTLDFRDHELLKNVLRRMLGLADDEG